MRRALLFVILLVSGCELEGDAGPDCDEPPAEGPACCDPDVYARVSVTDLLSDPGAHVERWVEVEGIADWYSDPNLGGGCSCAGDLCGCVTPLGLRSPTCGTILRLGGNYRGQPVQCAESGCWPLVVLSPYAVCGRFVSAGNTGVELAFEMVVDSFCER